VADTHDRRRHTRFDITLNGLLTAPGRPVSRCVVRDYCLGGLLVETPGRSTNGPRVGDEVRVDAKLELPEGPRPVAIKARVVWARESYFGLSFGDQSPDYVALLGQHGHSVAEHGGVGRISGSEARARAKLRHAGTRLLPTLLRDLLVDANERLLDLADRVRSNSEQAQLFADMNALDRLRQGDRLVTAVLEQCETLPEADVPAKAESGLSLIDADEFERWLEASRTATVLDRQYGETLSKLASRLAAMRDPAAPHEMRAPFEPQHFTKALKVIAVELELGRASRGQLFEATQQVLGDKLEAFYTELDVVLDQLGAPQASPTQYRVNKATDQGDTEKAATEAVPDSPAAPNGDQAPAAAPSPVTGLSAFPAVQIDPDAVAQARRQASESRVAQASGLLREASNLPGLTASLESWLQALATPLQHAAVNDAALFHDPANPLRQIIDALGHLQMFRPAPDGPEESDELRHQVETLLQPIRDGATDQAEIGAIAHRISELTHSESLRYQQNVERVVEANEGRERVREARVRVVTTLNQRYALKEVPEVFTELLDVGWRSVLELALLRDGDVETRFGEHLDLLDELSIGLGGESFQPERECRPAKDLLHAIGKELTAAAFDPFRVSALGKRIARELKSRPEGSVPLVRFSPLEVHDDDDACFAPPSGIADDNWPAILDRCEEVRVGDRLQFVKEAKADLRVAWIRADRGIHTLVDHRGLRQRDISCADLALGLYRREILLEHADGEPLSERAVHGLLTRMEERLTHETSHDSLTGLINQNQFRAAVEQLLRRADGHAGVMLSIDIDQFRLINDLHGYDNGDRLLVAVARLLEQAKGFSVLAHVGGDRFAMLLPDVSADEALPKAQSLCERVGGMPFSVAANSLTVSVSIGLVVVDGADGLGRVMQAADDALSAAKAGGGNRVYQYTDDDPEIRRHRESVQWVAQVDEALARGRLKLRCQAIVPVMANAGLAPHYEVLLGVTSASQDNLPIAEFIAAAERYSRMRAVDRWVTQTVIEWIAAHPADMPRLHGFAVNLSGQTASDPAFVDFLRQQFQRTGIDPSWLSLEITETAAVSDLSASAGIVQDFKKIGCRVALDDFGSGLASYSYLKELPVDWLKIDGAFVRKVAADSGDYAVVKSINEIGHFLGKETIAEYVADERILRLVAEIGVDYAQGYAIAEPCLMDDLVAVPRAEIA
jgi:diguanylate cyclase (GGDEF)-like protein